MWTAGYWNWIQVQLDEDGEGSARQSWMETNSHAVVACVLLGVGATRRKSSQVLPVNCIAKCHTPLTDEHESNVKLKERCE